MFTSFEKNRNSKQFYCNFQQSICYLKRQSLIIEQAKIIVNLNNEKLIRLDFSLLCWQTVMIKIIHQFEDGLGITTNQEGKYVGLYITLIKGKAKNQPLYYGLGFLANDKEIYQILALSHCTFTIIKDLKKKKQQVFYILLNQENYYSLCQYQVLESLSKVSSGVDANPSIISNQMIKSTTSFGEQIIGFNQVQEGEICIKKLIQLQTQPQGEISKEISHFKHVIKRLIIWRIEIIVVIQLQEISRVLFSMM
ncbi:unnamed protein product [Paramecium sonneborni]|uniref:Uncharacterized protein n=1 Tax=Paramecium sonneborni TaxID=65129 RepID=A0A8S1L111_9CILI|nr:unnamed protein product [Paramecium sonneborni]